jgi:hypothetical protein
VLLEDLKRKYRDGSGGRRHFLVTEVTRMSRPEVCVAAIDLQRLTLVRLLQWNHRNWPKELAVQGLEPGRIVRQRIRPVQDHHGFPHETEDTQLSDPFEMLDLVAETELFAYLAPMVDGSIDDMFSGNVEEGRYVEDETHCRSLGSILVPAATTDIGLDGFGKMRLSFRENSGVAYTLPITDLRVADDEDSGFTATRARIARTRKKGADLLLRVGLARGFDADGKWNPKRCYVQVNGIIFPV